jgi:NhaP-type Na+/H+ or K+/H+ antiporter
MSLSEPQTQSPTGVPTGQRFLPFLSAGFVFVLAASSLAFYYHISDEPSEGARRQPLSSETYTTLSLQQQEMQRRLLRDIINNGPEVINDDITRDETCKEYMSKFLNGTTDVKDECEGMHNAYQAADCVEDTHTQLVESRKKKKKHHHDKDNTTDDDIMIDDWYEQWECCSSISDYYKTHCREPELNSGRLLSIVGALVVCSLVKAVFHQVLGLEWLPDAAIYVLVGAVIGGILRVLAPEVVVEQLTFNKNLFLHILLPPIVFQAALKIDKRSFRRDLFPILSFAVIGTVMSAVAVGLITYYMTRLGGGIRLPMLDSLLFGSLISSIDPVATLGILSSVGVSQRDTLYTLIFGESLMNDGVAIVLFDTLVKHLGDTSVVDRATLLTVLRHFAEIAFGSVAIGIVCGGCCTLYFYNLWGKHTAVTEVAIFFSWAMIPYYLTDMLRGSGIIAIMTMGFFLDYYVIGGNQSEEGEWMDFMQFRCNNDRAHSEGDLARAAPEPSAPSRCDHLRLSWSRAFSGRGHILSKSRHHVGFVAEVISDIMETAIFCYLGVFLFNDNNTWDLRLNSVAIFGCVASRFGMVVAISLLVNMCVFCDVEEVVCGSFRRTLSNLCAGRNHNPLPTRSATTTMSAPLLSHYDDPPTGEEEIEEDDDPEASVNKRFLDVKTQTMLLLAGVRGAVSFALVTNIPLYDAVTKRGSQYKHELKAMTSASIIFTLFVFGALTYIMVRKDQANPNRERLAGSFTHRLTSLPLASDNEGDEEEEEDFDAVPDTSLMLEMETETPRPTRFS